MKTEAGKVGKVEVDTRTAMYRFSWESGGEVPLILSGLFTSHTELHKAWNRYLASKK